MVLIAREARRLAEVGIRLRITDGIAARNQAGSLICKGEAADEHPPVERGGILRVEEVEHLRDELDAHAFANRELLADAEVELRERRPANRVYGGDVMVDANELRVLRDRQVDSKPVTRETLRDFVCTQVDAGDVEERRAGAINEQAREIDGKRRLVD